MKLFKKIKNRLRGLTCAIIRYPFTMMFFIGADSFIAFSIQLDIDYSKQLLTCMVGAFICASFQAAYERFFKMNSARFLLMGVGCVLTLGYYLILNSAPKLSMEIGIRTGVTLFALAIAYIWLPVIQSRISFNESFMATFKAFFHSVFYSLVLYAGASVVIMAINELLYDINYKVYPHTANIVFVVLAPLFFFSHIPVYPGKKNMRSKGIDRASCCPRFLEILISYIMIPLTTVFTAVLILYIIPNIRGEFWKNNLLEPMLVSYAITVILIYILASRLENDIANLYRLVIPKILILIVMVQIAATIFCMRELGVTHIRYFVLSFGIFAVCAGIVMSVLPVQKNGFIAGLLIVISMVTIIPPMDAFSVSRNSQEQLLRSVLVRNGMLENNIITPNDSISDADKKKIASSARYLFMMGYSHGMTWLPEDFMVSKDFYNTFGFYEDYEPERNEDSFHLGRDSNESINIRGYDLLVHDHINSREEGTSTICEFEKFAKKYVLEKRKTGESYDIVLFDDQKREMIRFHTNEFLEISNADDPLSNENAQVKLTIIIQDATINRPYYYVDFYILLKIK